MHAEKTRLLYIGQTNNLSDRIKRHNKNQNKWTRFKGPWKVLYSFDSEVQTEVEVLQESEESSGFMNAESTNASLHKEFA